LHPKSAVCRKGLKDATHSGARPKYNEQSERRVLAELDLSPADDAIMLCVDEKPQVQALEQNQGRLRLPNGKALIDRTHEYRRHGTTILFAAQEMAT